MYPNNNSIMPSRERGSRRRYIVPTAALLLVACASFASAVEVGIADDDDDIYRRRRLSQSAAEAFANLTPEKASRALPLDLRIDIRTGNPYLSGRGGYLQSYASAFVASSPSSSSFSSTSSGPGGDVVARSSYWDGIMRLDDVMGRQTHKRRPHQDQERQHATSTSTSSNYDVEDDADDGLYYEILRGDGTTTTGGNLRGSSSGGGGGGSRSLRVVKDEDGTPPPTGDAAATFANSSSSSTTTTTSSPRIVPSSSSEAEAEAEDDSSNDNNMAENFASSNMEAMDERRPMPRGSSNGDGKKKSNKSNNQTRLPRIGNVSPPRGSAIRDAQTFSARVLPSRSTNSPVSTVHFVLTDMDGNTSDPLEVPLSSSSSDGLYEITIDGFSNYGGTTWTYSVIAKDQRGKRRSTDAISFDVVTTKDLVWKAPPAPSPPSSSSSSSSSGSDTPMPKKYETDSDWTRGGAIQSATGRILFEFDGSAETYVCSGTVIRDGPDGQTPDHDNGRSIVQTAAHCAYSDVLKRFATRAVFVPDQDATIGKESDFDCMNDRYGCWHLSFAVVAEGWTLSGFPENVPYDYAYYVAYDDVDAHSGGYEGGLSGILDRDVTSMKIDFDVDVDDDEFIFSLGYSADKDPSLRHCAMERTSIRGVEWYENYWLDNCAMTGGASGGPWLKDVDSNGVGTLISVNSWGFAHRIGMAGPNLRTSSGSLAECLYEKAKYSKDPGSEGGYVVTTC